MKRRAIFLLAAALFLGTYTPALADSAPDISAHSAIVIHSDSGRVLFEKNADERMLIASTTKIMTALVVLENCNMDDTVTVGAESAGVEGSSMYLKAGGEYSVRDLLCGLLLVSGNDAAIALALHTAGSVEAFAELMNSTAERIGMTSSHFMNPHGLDEDGHYSTARDLSLLTRVCMRNPDFRAIVSSKSAVTADGQTLYNHNKLLSRCEGCVGVKTGYTRAAGRSLVSCCVRGDAEYICVTLDAPSDWDDHEKLYDWAFGTFRCEAVLSENLRFPVHVVSGVTDEVYARPVTTARLLLDEADTVSYETELPSFVFAPVAKNARAGSVTVLINGEPRLKAELYYENGAELRRARPAVRLSVRENLGEY